MKYKIDLTIDIPKEKFLELFEDLEFMKQWQPTLKSLEVVSGSPGQVGSKSILKYESNGKPSQIEEEIIKRDLPYEFDFIYRAGGVTNWAYNRFDEVDGKTVWSATHVFKFSFAMFFLNLMKGAFIKQTTKDMNAFKEAAENLK
jgi:uncharacterized membrane protein